jgi:hypothetical protein
MNLPKQKVGMMMDISTESVIVLLPVATAFVGFMVSLVEGGIQGQNLGMTAYEVFLLSVLFDFYDIVMLLIGIPLTVGAVFASGAFGALTSPLGDTTITTASILDMELVDYAQYKLRISAIDAVISMIIYLV